MINSPEDQNKMANLILPESQKVTYELVSELADSLEMNGIEPTVARIRALNRDRGSATTITPLLKRWKERRDTEHILTQSVLTDDLKDMAAPLLRRLLIAMSGPFKEELERRELDEAQLVEQLHQKDERRLELESQLKDRTETISALEHSLVEQKETISALSNELEQRSAQVAELDHRLREQQKENFILRAKVQSGADRASELLADIERYRIDLATSAKERQDLHEDNRSLQESCRELSQQILKLNASTSPQKQNNQKD